MKSRPNLGVKMGDNRHVDITFENREKIRYESDAKVLGRWCLKRTIISNEEILFGPCELRQTKAKKKVCDATIKSMKRILIPVLVDQIHE